MKTNQRQTRSKQKKGDKGRGLATRYCSGSGLYECPDPSSLFSQSFFVGYVFVRAGQGLGADQTRRALRVDPQLSTTGKSGSSASFICFVSWPRFVSSFAPADLHFCRQPRRGLLRQSFFRFNSCSLTQRRRRRHRSHPNYASCLRGTVRLTVCGTQYDLEQPDPAAIALRL